MKYIQSLIDSVPHEIYIVTAIVFVVALMCFIVWKGFKKGVVYSSALLLLQYVFVLYSSTFIFREPRKERKYNFQPFWNYNEISEEKTFVLSEILMNVAVFIPIGLLLGIVFSRIAWWKVVLIGSLISMSIEFSQFAFMRGFAETNDVIHNTLGCLIGYMLYKGFAKGRRLLSLTRLADLADLGRFR